MRITAQGGRWKILQQQKISSERNNRTAEPTTLKAVTGIFFVISVPSDQQVWLTIITR